MQSTGCNLDLWALLVNNAWAAVSLIALPSLRRPPQARFESADKAKAKQLPPTVLHSCDPGEEATYSRP
jgi:hypothetical protein